MKKFLCLALCLMLMLTALPSLAAEYSMPEKFIKQTVGFGSGIKGTIVFTVEGTSPLAQALLPLSGVDLELRSIISGDIYQHQLYALSGEQQVGLTQLYGDAATMAVKSELLPNVLLTLPTDGDVVNTLLGGSGDGNPGWYSAAVNMLMVSSAAWEEAWTPALESYYTAIELWLKAYSAAPSVTTDDQGKTLMLMRYEIPVSSVKTELNTLLAQMLTDETLMTLVRAQMTEQQQSAYLNADLLSYYADAVAALPMEGTVTLERELTTMGDARRTMLAFPLPTNEGGWTSFAMEQDEGDLTLSIIGADRTVELVMKSTTATETTANYQGILRILPGAESEEQPLSASFDLSKTYATQVDDDTREHNITTWELAVEPDLSHLAEDDPAREQYQQFEPLSGSVTIHFHSKNANTSPTNLLVDATLAMQDATIGVSAQIKTTSPWVLQDMTFGGGESMATLTEERKTELLATFLSNAVQTLTTINPTVLPMPEATSTDIGDNNASDETTTPDNAD